MRPPSAEYTKPITDPPLVSLTCCPNSSGIHCKKGVAHLVWLCFIRHFMVRVLFLLAIWLNTLVQIDSLLLSYHCSVIQMCTNFPFSHAPSATGICCHLISSLSHCIQLQFWYTVLVSSIDPWHPGSTRCSPTAWYPTEEPKRSGALDVTATWYSLLYSQYVITLFDTNDKK